METRNWNGTKDNAEERSSSYAEWYVTTHVRRRGYITTSGLETLTNTIQPSIFSPDELWERICVQATGLKALCFQVRGGMVDDDFTRFYYIFFMSVMG